jgi:hypothetical protein
MREAARGLLEHRRMPVNFVLEDCPEQPTERQLGVIATAITDHVSYPEVVKVVISSDFVACVQAYTNDPREQAGYDTDRLFGTVGAKTIDADDSRRSTILFPYETVTSLGEPELYRLAAHESLHAALHQRDEKLTNLALRMGLDLASAAALWAELAGTAIDEYRVERALDDEGWALTPSYWLQIPATLTTMRERIRAALDQRRPEDTIDAVYNAVMGAFHRTNLLFAYAAAEEIASGGEVAVKIPEPDCERLVGDSYVKFRDLLGAIASATEPVPLADLIAAGEDLALVLYDWLVRIGFDLYDPETGPKWFGIDRSDF